MRGAGLPHAPAAARRPARPLFRLSAALAMAVAVGAAPGGASARAPPAPGVTEADPEGLAALRSRILAADSATLALEGWCAEHRLAADPHLVAVRLPVPDKPLTAAQRARLGIGPDEPMRYRRVRLACGDRVLSEADNWYVPARLTPEMNAVLDTTRTPFGRVVRPLAPVRRTLDQRSLAPAGRPGTETALFEIDALLTSAAGDPFCEVAETYLGGALPAAGR